MSQRDRIDATSRTALEQLLAAIPGGINAIRDIDSRRQTAESLLAAAAADVPLNERVIVESREITGAEDSPSLGVRIYRPAAISGHLPGILHIHGGGMVLGTLDGEGLVAAKLCEEVGAVVVSTDYRKAPEHRHPAQSDDCYAALCWMATNADAEGIDADRIAVYGGSAGGNLAIAISLIARDKGYPAIRFLMAPYPMLDDRNITYSSREITEIGVWDRAANIEAWEHFLGGLPADGYAAPSRMPDLSGLPPTFIDVGEMDVFRDEALEFVQRLVESDVPSEFHLYSGAYHGSEVFAANAPLSQRIWANRSTALRSALAASRDLASRT